MTTIDALKIRHQLGRDVWAAPTPFGPDGWLFDHKTLNGRIIVTASDFDGMEIIHASMAFRDVLPTYEELVLLHRAIFPGYSYQVFAPEDAHVNIHANALHLWGRADGKPMMPEFGIMGMI